MFLGLNHRHLVELAAQLHVVPGERGAVDLDGVIDQLRGVDGFDDARDFGVALLHGDDLLDVLDVLQELLEFLQQSGLFVGEMLRPTRRDTWESAGPRGSLAKNSPRRVAVFHEQRGGFGKVGDLRSFRRGQWSASRKRSRC